MWVDDFVIKTRNVQVVSNQLNHAKIYFKTYPWISVEISSQYNDYRGTISSDHTPSGVIYFTLD